MAKSSSSGDPSPGLTLRQLERMRREFVSNFVYREEEVDYDELSMRSPDLIGVKLTSQEIKKIAKDNCWMDQARHALRLVQVEVSDALRRAAVKSKTQAVKESLGLAEVIRGSGASLVAMAARGLDSLIKAQQVDIDDIGDVMKMMESGTKYFKYGLEETLRLYAQEEGAVAGDRAPREELVTSALNKLDAASLEDVLAALTELVGSEGSPTTAVIEGVAISGGNRSDGTGEPEEYYEGDEEALLVEEGEFWGSRAKTPEEDEELFDEEDESSGDEGEPPGSSVLFDGW